MPPHSLKKFVLCLSSAGEQLRTFAKTNCLVGELHESAAGWLLPHCTRDPEGKGTLQNLCLTSEMPLSVMLERCVRSQKDKGEKFSDFCNIHAIYIVIYGFLGCVTVYLRISLS